ncbi:MAG: hypothetical protein JRN02_04925 [Nitrososphaerota archaeon]|nr:hypothetical protein [Nitrososphaerota archaeon]MDG7048893.1 hypothetical protein [Nitrososphaerota archaeon]
MKVSKVVGIISIVFIVAGLALIAAPLLSLEGISVQLPQSYTSNGMNSFTVPVTAVNAADEMVTIMKHQEGRTFYVLNGERIMEGVTARSNLITLMSYRFHIPRKLNWDPNPPSG